MTFDVAELKNRAQDLLDAMNDLDLPRSYNPYAGGSLATAFPGDDAILSVYDDFLDVPSPDDFGTVVNNLETPISKLATNAYHGDNLDDPTGRPNSDLNGVQSAGIEIDNWTGQAAKTFFSSYAQNFKDYAGSQFLAYWILRQAINAEAAVWQTVRDDLDKLSNDATSQMKQVDDCTKDDWEAVLSVAGAVVGIAAAVPTGGASLSVTAVVGAGVGVASTGVGLLGSAGEPDSFGLSHNSPTEVYDSLVKALGKIKSYITDSEKAIQRSVDQAMSLTEPFNAFCLSPPALASVPRKSVYSVENVGTY